MVDSNQGEIVKAFEKLGCFVKTGMDDILVFYGDYWVKQVEIKVKSPFQKNGKIEADFIKDSQYHMLCYANDCYVILWTIDQATNLVVYSEGFNKHIITPDRFRRHYKQWLSTKELNRLRQKPWWNLR